MQKDFKLFFLFIIGSIFIMLQAGCGYQLQKPLAVDSSLQPIYIEGDLKFKILLTRRLQEKNIHTSSSRINANSIIKITAAEQDTRSLSVSNDGRDAEHHIVNRVFVSWQKADKTLLAETAISAESVQINKPDQLAAQQAESDLIQTETHNDIIDKVLRLIRYTSH